MPLDDDLTPPPDWPSTDAVEVTETSARPGAMSALRKTGGKVIALVLALFLVLPAGAWLVDALVFSQRGGDVAEAAPALADAVALVTRRGCDGSIATGSGFALDLEGVPVLVTNRHVVQGASSVSLRTLDGALGPAVTQVLVSPLEDVAVLLLDESLGSSLAIGRDASIGDEVRLVGFPGARPVTTTGAVSDMDATRTLLSFEVGGGASGAPVVDASSIVVAQVVARRSDGTGVAISASALVAGLRSVQPDASC